GLVHMPGVFFSGEPTAGQDPESRTALWDEIGRPPADDGLTMLLTTHYLEEADRLASHVAIVDRGRIVAGGTPDELKGQLRGDAVHIDLADHTERGRLLAVLERVPAVREIRMDGSHVSARADEGAAALPAVLAALDDAGVPVRAATVARPSL